VEIHVIPTRWQPSGNRQAELQYQTRKRIKHLFPEHL